MYSNYMYATKHSIYSANSLCSDPVLEPRQVNNSEERVRDAERIQWYLHVRTRERFPASVVSIVAWFEQEQDAPTSAANLEVRRNKLPLITD